MIFLRALVALLALTGSARADMMDTLLLLNAKTAGILPGAAVDLNFATGAIYPANAFIVETRNSIATEDDLTGTWSTFPALRFRRTNKGHLGSEEVRTNSVPNSTAAGGGVGVTPTGWSITGGNGVTCSSVGVGVESGINYDLIQCAGTTTAITNLGAVFNTAYTSAPAAQNQVWSISAFSKLVSGSMGSPSIPLSLNINELNSSGTLVTQDGGSNLSFGTNALGTQRTSGSFLLTGATTAYAQLFMNMQYAASTAVNFTIEIGWPQLEKNPNATTTAQGFATSPIPTSSGAVTRAADNSSMILPAGACSTAGCSLWATATFEAPTAFPNGQFVGVVSDGTANNEVNLFRAATSGFATGQSYKAASGVQVVVSGSLIGPASTAKLAAYVTAALLSVAYNNGTPASTASSGVPPVTQIAIGSAMNGAAPCNCYVSRIAVAPISLLGD